MLAQPVSYTMKRLWKSLILLVFIPGIIFNAGCSDRQAEQVNTRPTVEITYPLENTIFNSDDAVAFVCFGGDTEDGQLNDDLIVWDSSIDGKIGRGRSFTRPDLSAGKHTITVKATDRGGAVGSDSIRIFIKPTTTHHPVVNGAKTAGVVHPENAFDGDGSTAATLTRYWGENDHFDWLHLVALVGDDDRFTFKISAGASTPGSTLSIEAQSASGTWEEILKILLDHTASKLITIVNARKFVNSDGYISLRARWVEGSSDDDCRIFEIARKPSPTVPVSSPARVIMMDL